MLTTQMNVRMDAKTKPSGDQALASIGYTPSSVVQAIWRFADRNRHDRKALLELRNLLEPAERDPETPKQSWTREAPLIYKHLLEDMGVESAPASFRQTDEELLLQAHLEKMAERGTLS